MCPHFSVPPGTRPLHSLTYQPQAMLAVQGLFISAVAQNQILSATTTVIVTVYVGDKIIS